MSACSVSGIAFGSARQRLPFTVAVTGPGAGDTVGAERLVPDPEEVPERVMPRDRGLDRDQPVGRTRVHPVHAGLCAVEKPGPPHSWDLTDHPDPARQRARAAVDIDLKVGIGGVGELRERLALDAIYEPAGLRGRGGGEEGAGLDRDALGPDVGL